MLKTNRTPDLVIGPEDNPYMLRWWLKKDGKFGDLYLHKICRSDEARALHDHRADNISLILKGSYTEIIAPKDPYCALGYNLNSPITRRFGPGSVIHRKAEQPHRLVLDTETELKFNPHGFGNYTVTWDKPVWTLWFKFKERREWGFWQKMDGRGYVWMHYKEFTDAYGFA